LVISDSGSITEEAGILKIPAISLREDIERQEGMDEGIIMMSDINSDRVFNSIDVLLKTHSSNFPLNLSDYSSPNVSDKVVRIISNYISFINRRVWKKKNK
jgi:UDP-N-acetylglucosamine 2-epimerase (non-hydrolysing)